MPARTSTLRVQTTTTRPSKAPPSIASPGGLTVLKKDLGRCARTHDRAVAIRSLQNCLLLGCIPLDASPMSPANDWKTLEDEVASSSLLLNGHAFEAKKYSNIHTMRVMKELCRLLCQGVDDVHPDSLYKALIVRLAKSNSSADCYFNLTAALGSQDLVVQAPANPFSVASSELVVYQADGSIHATFTVHHPFGLFRKSDLASGRPWIKVVAVAHERVNLSTGASARHVSLKVVPDQ